VTPYSLQIWNSNVGFEVLTRANMKVVTTCSLPIKNNSVLSQAVHLQQWLRHYAASRKVAGSRLYEVDFLIYLILPDAL
jgi:hypothetical protein